MLKSVYTNTSKPSAVVGLLVLTVGLAYAKENSTKIVDGTVAACKDAKFKVEESIIHRGKKAYPQVGFDRNGKMKQTGTYWK